MKKKLLTGIICTVFTALFATTVIMAGSVAGDVNNDGKLTARDALAVLKSCASIDPGEGYEVSTETADINADGVVNAADAREILRQSVGTQNWDAEGLKEPFSGKAYIMADSIAAQHNTPTYDRPLVGWGVVFSDYYIDSFYVDNKAISSQSTKTYALMTYYNLVIDKLEENDYAFIGFGHNDHTEGIITVRDEKIDRTTDVYGDENTEGTYKWYLKNYYIDKVLAKGAVAIVLTPVCRATFDENDKFFEDPVHLQCAKACRELVEEYQAQGKSVYLIDTQKYTYDLYNSYNDMPNGKAEIMSYHGAQSYTGGQYENGFFDNTHYCEKGARMLAEYITEQLKELNLDISRYIKVEE